MNSREKLQLSVKFGVTDVLIEHSLFWGRVLSFGLTVAGNKLSFCDSFIRRNAMPTTKHIIPVVTTVEANTRSLRDIRPSFRSTWVSVLPTESSGKWLPCRSCNSWFNEPIVDCLEWSVCSLRLKIICRNPQSLEMHWSSSIARLLLPLDRKLSMTTILLFIYSACRRQRRRFLDCGFVSSLGYLI